MSAECAQWPCEESSETSLASQSTTIVDDGKMMIGRLIVYSIQRVFVTAGRCLIDSCLSGTIENG